MKNKYIIAAAAVLFGAGSARAASVDLSGWTAEGPGTWNVQPGNDSVIQTTNGNPTVFYSDFNAFGSELAGTVQVRTNTDDDFIGFVLGYNPGDLSGTSTDFLIIDWKQADQFEFGCQGLAGLAISRASSGLTGGNSGSWCHSGNGVAELARATTLGNTGWADQTEYTFSIEYTASNVKVYVDNVLQLDVDGTFSDGRFGFYNYSQQTVEYAGITTAVLPSVPEPGTWALMMLGMGIVGGAMRARRKGQISLRHA